MAKKETMTPRERLLRALNHQVPDRVPIDLGGNQTGIHKNAYRALVKHLGIADEVLLMDAVQQLAKPTAPSEPHRDISWPGGREGQRECLAQNPALPRFWHRPDVSNVREELNYVLACRTVTQRGWLPGSKRVDLFEFLPHDLAVKEQQRVESLVLGAGRNTLQSQMGEASERTAWISNPLSWISERTFMVSRRKQVFFRVD